MRTICHSMEKITLTNLFFNNVPTWGGMARLSTTPKWKHKCESPSWTKRIPLQFMLIYMRQEELGDSLIIGGDGRAIWLSGMTWKSDWFSASTEDADICALYIWPYHDAQVDLGPLLLNNEISSVSSMSNSSAFLTSAGKTVVTAGLDTSSQSSSVASRCMNSYRRRRHPTVLNP